VVGNRSSFGTTGSKSSSSKDVKSLRRLRVFKGLFNSTQVALKVRREFEGVILWS